MRAPITSAAASGDSVALADTLGDLELTALTGASRTLRRASASTAVAYAPDGTLVAGSSDGTIRIWKLGVTSPSTVRAPGPVLGVSTARGRFLARTADGSVHVYTLDGAPVGTIAAHAGRAVLSPGGTVRRNGRRARRGSLGRGEREAPAPADGPPFARHRRRVLAGRARSSPRASTTTRGVWDAASGRLLHVLRGHFFPVRSASFSPDGSWIVTASQLTAGLWDASTGQLVLYLNGQREPLTGATFGLGGKWILTGSDDGTARVVRCDICRNLAGLEQLARERLHSVHAAATLTSRFAP